VVDVLNRPSADDDVLLAAIAAARQHAEPASQDALTRLLTSDRPAQVLAAALRALGEMQASPAVSAVRVHVHHPDIAVRGAAVDALARIGGRQAVQALIEALGDADPGIRRNAVDALGGLGTRDAVPALLEACKSPETRSQAIIALARIPDSRAFDVYLEGLGTNRGGVREACRGALAAIRDEVRPRVRDRLQTSLPAPIVNELGQIYAGDRELAPVLGRGRKPEQPEQYAAFALAKRGDANRGRALFEDPEGVACLKCHRVNGAGGEGGPDLSRIAATYGRAELIESVLFPSKKVADGFRTTILALADGQTLSGLRIADGDQVLTLIDSQGAKHDVRKSDIEQRTQSDISPMPEGLRTRLTREQFSDLIAYLETLR
jgi:quinoprotein glucose dehydrogenase